MFYKIKCQSCSFEFVKEDPKEDVLCSCGEGIIKFDDNGGILFSKGIDMHISSKKITVDNPKSYKDYLTK